jgi:hypothetical protein
MSIHSPTLQDVYDMIFKAQQDESIVLEQDPRLKMHINDVTQIYNVYLFGSRLYQCHSDDSDYDFICVLGGDYFDGSKLFQSDLLNVNVYHWEYFKHLLKENMVWAAMLINVPREFVWKEQMSLSDHFVLDLNRLKNSALQDASHNWAKAKRLCIQESLRNIKVSKKNIVHGIRYLRMTLQLCQHGKVIDFTDGNDIWKELFDVEEPEFNSVVEQWNYYDSKYKNMFQDAMRAVKYYAFVPESIPIEQISTSKHARKPKPLTPYMASETKKLGILKYIKLHGLQSLKRDFSIQISRPFTNYPELIACVSDKLHTPIWQCDSSVVRECATLVLKEDQSDYTVVAMSHLPIMNRYSDEGIDCDFVTDLINIAWNDGVKIYEKIDGFAFLLFRYEGNWLLYTPKVTQSKFKRYFTIHIAQFRRISDETESVLLEHLTKFFWNVWNKNNYKLPDDSSRDTYLFELCLDLSKYELDREFLIDSTTVQHDTDKIYFHGIIGINNSDPSFTEYEFEQIGTKHGWTTPKRFDTIINGTTDASDRDAALKKFVRSLDPMKSEGLIIMDKYFNRLKFVSPQVDALRELQIADIMENNTNQRNIDIVTKINDYCTFLECSPWKDQKILNDLYQKSHAQVVDFCNYIQHIYDNIKQNTSSQKEFVEQCRQYPFHFIFFDLSNTMNHSAREFYAATINRKVIKSLQVMKEYRQTNEK